MRVQLSWAWFRPSEKAWDAGALMVLTPHLTGPNTTDAVRKAYIVQYAPPDARLQQGDPAAGPPTGEVTADVPERQFPVLRDGAPV